MPTFTWTLPDPLNNTAKTLSIYVTELQDAINVKRTEISLAPITFIDQGIGKKFRLDAVEELKTVINDLAILYGYPTGVEDPALLGRPYVIITKKYGKYVCHYPILNDLRQVLNTLEIQLKFNIIVPVLTGWAIVSEYKDSTIKINNVVPFGWTYPTSSIFLGSGSVISELFYSSGTIYITKINKDTGDSSYGWDVGDVIRHRRGTDICAGQQGTELSYQYVLGEPLSGGNNKVIRYKNIVTFDLVATDIFDLGANYTSSSIVNNEDFVFVGGQNWAGIPSYWNAVITKLAKGVTMSLATQNSFYLDLITLPVGGTITGKQAKISALTIDSFYIYCFYQEQLQYKILPDPTIITLLKSAIIKIDLNTLNPIVLIQSDDTVKGYYTYPVAAGMALQGDYLYTVGERHLPIIGKLVVRTKSGTFVASFDSLDYKDGSGSEDINVACANCIASNDERLAAIPS